MGSELPARVGITSAETQEGLPLDDQGRMNVTFTRMIITGLYLPDDVASSGIQGDEKAVRSSPVHFVFVDGNATRAVEGLGTRNVRGQSALITPHQLPGDHVDGEDSASAFGKIENAVGDDRSRRPPTTLL